MNAFEEIKWSDYPVSSSAAYGVCSLSIGEIGEGSPTATIIAGVHGDEGPWGALAIKYLFENIKKNEIVGSLRIIPVANPLAMEADSRVSPLDNLDLNRVFPGDQNGSHTQRLAATIVEKALNGSEYVYDLHGGGSWCVNAFGFSFTGSEDLILSINPPFIVESTQKKCTLTGYSMRNGAKVTAIEMGGRGKQENEWAKKIAEGIRRSLIDVGVIKREKTEAKHREVSIKVGPTTVLRPDHGGIFVPVLDEESVGTVIEKDSILGRIVDPVTMNCIQEFTAPFNETAILLLRHRMCVVEGGAMIYVVAPLRGKVSS